MIDWDDLEQTIQLGRQLVEAGADPDDLLSRLAMGDYFRRQRELVARYGCCGRHETWISPMGLVLCKHTREPCPDQRLREIVKLWAGINGGTNCDNRSRESRRWGRGHRARRK